MFLGLPMQIYFFSGLMLAGSLAGFLAGFFGLGGGIILVPLMVSLFPYFGLNKAISMHFAVGTSLALMIPSSISASYKQYRFDNIDWDVLKHWGIGLTVGVLTAILLSHFYPSLNLNLIFVVFLYSCLLISLLPKKISSEKLKKRPATPLLIFASFITGCLATSIGIGGGTITTPFFNACRYPIKKAFAIASASTMLVSLGGTLSSLASKPSQVTLPYSIGYINIPAFLIISPLLLIFVPIGVSLAHRVDERLLKRLYMPFLIIITIYMTVKLIL